MSGEGRFQAMVKTGMGYFSGGVNSLFLKGPKYKFSVETGDGAHKLQNPSQLLLNPLPSLTSLL